MFSYIWKFEIFKNIGKERATISNISKLIFLSVMKFGRKFKVV